MKSEDKTPEEELQMQIGPIENQYKRYEIDFDKVNDIDDVIMVLKGLKLRVVNPLDHGLGDLMPYLKEVKDDEH